MCLCVPSSRYSINACKIGTTARNYNCEICEYYGICDFKDVIARALKTRDFSELPDLVAEQLFRKIAPEIMVETNELIASWKPKLDPKRLP